jgi:L-glyceraldehyde 3-phosphate reductase
MGALVQAHRQGKALYVGISSYSPELTRQAQAILASEGVPLLIHQPSYSMMNRWIEGGLLDTLGDLGIGCIAFSPLAQGMLTSKYLGGIPDDARAVRGRYFPKQALTEETLGSLRALDALARERGQTLAQMAIAWALRDPRVTSALIGARTVGQLEDSLAALRGLEFRGEELARIDELAGDAGINIWQASSSIEAF